MTFSWTPTKAAADKQVASFLPHCGSDYTAKRNFTVDGTTSCLSPWLRHRLILEQDVLTSCLAEHDLEVAQSFVQEIFWRGYFKGYLENHPQIWLSYQDGLSVCVDQLGADETLRQQYSLAVGGKTGIDCFDAWANQLVETGYLHNHERMWFASIWIFTLKLPWHLGADFFLFHLLDGDAASNTLSWRWVAGLHTKGKHYVARPTNILQFTNGLYNPVGQLDENPKALTEKEEFLKFPLPAEETLPAGQAYGLLITEEDCQPETLALPQSPTAIMGVVAKSAADRSAKVEDFAMGAMDDALQRCCNHFQVGASLVDASEWGSALVDWAQQSDIKVIVTAYAPIGATAERLADAEPMLEEAGIKLIELRRPYDSNCWPHATKGFFALKGKIPGLISKLEHVSAN